MNSPRQGMTTRSATTRDRLIRSTPVGRLLRFVHGIHSPGDRGQTRLRLSQEPATDFGHADPAGGPVEQAHTQDDPPAERTVCESAEGETPISRAAPGEALVVGDAGKGGDRG